MSILTRLNSILPGVKGPKKNLSLKEKLIWTGLILVIFYVMSQIPIFGMAEASFERFQTFETILGASMGSLITLGIGPIVSASIILQLLVGSEIIPWDLNSQEGQAKFQGTQKLLAFIIALIEAVAYVVMGAIAPLRPTPAFFAVVIFQVALGGWLIIFLDEIISKWGFGSGVGLFIVAGVSKTIIIGSLSPLNSAGQLFSLAGGDPVGIIPAFITGLAKGAADPFILIPLLMTVFIFVIAVYAQAMRVEIPLTMGNVRGFGRKWPLKFIYTSVLPVILVSALLANIRLWATVLADRGVDLVIGGFHLIGEVGSQGSFAPNSLLYYVSAPSSNFLINLGLMNVQFHQVIQVIVYTTVYTLGAIVFSIFWMKTSGQDPASVAEKISNTGMKVPGFRKNKRVLIKILNRYIPALTVLGGAFIGFLAAFANWTNALGSGTGILLTVMITFKLYEELAQKHLEEMHPAVRKFMGSS